MTRDAETTQRLSGLLTQLTSLTRSGELRWEKQVGSAHRYARWKNNLLILGPADPPAESKVPRYLFVTPFDSPLCIEVNSDDEQLGPALLQLVDTVDQSTKNEQAVDPFAVNDELLGRLAR